MTLPAATSQAPIYYQDEEVTVDGEIASFPDGSHYIADIIRAQVLTSETQFLGMDRDYVLPVLGGAVIILSIMASSAPELGYYFVVAVLYIAASILGRRARNWYKDKRQMYTYTVGLDTANGTVEAYTSTSMRPIRRIVLAVNRAIKAQGTTANTNPSPAIPQTNREEQPHTTRRKRGALSLRAHPKLRTRQKQYRHPAWRPEALPKLRKRH